MPFATVKGGTWIPQIPSQTSGVPSISSLLIDAAGEKAAFIIQVPKTGTITKVGFRTGIVTTGATVDVRVETVDPATGHPTGTLWGVNTNASQVISDVDDNVWFTVPLTAGAQVTRTDIIAVVIVNPSVSPGNLNIAMFGDTISRLPYSDHFTTVWTKSAFGPMVSLEYSDGSYEYIPHCWPMSSFTELLLNIGSTPDEAGLRFRFTVPVRITGGWIWCDLGGNGDIVLYDSDGITVLTSLSLNTNIRSAASMGLHFFLFTSAVALSRNTFYRMVLKPTTTTNLTLYNFNVATAAVMDSFEGGQDFHFTSRTDAGAWTDTLTRRPFMGLLLDQFDDGTGGGGTTTLVSVME